MLDGTQFVEVVKRLGYPGASTLKGEDFDWLFDAPEHQKFLRFFCGTVTGSNVLGPEEVQAYRALCDAGKPILDEMALGEALKACRTASSRESGYSAARLEEADTTQLEEELQALRRERKLKLRRHRKLQVLATSRADAALRLACRQEESSQKLKDAVAALGAENAETNAALQALSQEVRRLEAFLHTEPPVEHQAGTATSLAPVVFLSRVSLEPYLQQEEANTKTLALLAQKQFFPGIFDMVEASNANNFQLLDLSSCAGEEDECVEEAHRMEMTRLQWAHIVAQHKLLQTCCEEQAISTGLQWMAGRHREVAKVKASVPSLQACEAELRQELHALEAELEVLNCGRTPEALRESARLLDVPVVRGDFQLQMARQDYYTSRQDQVCRVLLQQKVSLELLQMAHELELRSQRLVCRQLNETAQRLEKARDTLGQRLRVYALPELSLAARPCSIISSKDSAFSRLCRVLEADRRPEQDQPHRTYEDLAQAALGLQEALHSAREALSAAAQEQAFGTTRLEGDCDVLRGAMYCRLQQPVLTPQVCAKAPQELCPNAQALKGRLEQLDAQLDSLNKLMKEILVDIRSKREQLERNSRLRRERELYAAFHLEPRLLRKMVEELENRVLRPRNRP